jgi:hypothetical protein
LNSCIPKGKASAEYRFGWLERLETKTATEFRYLRESALKRSLSGEGSPEGDKSSDGATGTVRTMH